MNLSKCLQENENVYKVKMGDVFMKTKEVIFLLNKMHEEVKALIIEEQTRNRRIIVIKGLVIKMYQNKISLSPQEILEKEFKIDTRGYRLKEVDQFLDVVISDYEQFFNIINHMEQEKAELLKEIMNLKQELRNARMNVEIAKDREPRDVNNVDVLRRLSQLEKMVYGKDD